MKHDSQIEPVHIAFGGCMVGLSVAFVGASYWYVRFFLTRGTTILSEPIGILAVAMAIILLGGWLAAGVAVYQRYSRWRGL